MNLWRENIIMFIIAYSVSVLSAEEHRIKIAVLDTGIQVNKETNPWLCKDGQYDFTGMGIEDVNGHGTNVSGLITKGLDVSKYCLVEVKYYHDDPKRSPPMPISVIMEAWEKIIEIKPAYVNMSLSGMSFWQDEYNTIRTLIDNGSEVVVAAGNDHLNLDVACVVFPACYKFSKQFYVVGAIDGKYSNVSKAVKFYSFGTNQVGFGIMETGSSQATANYLNSLIKRRENGLR